MMVTPLTLQDADLILRCLEFALNDLRHNPEAPTDMAQAVDELADKFRSVLNGMPCQCPNCTAEREAAAQNKKRKRRAPEPVGFQVKAPMFFWPGHGGNG
jgi:hypothetical protein